MTCLLIVAHGSRREASNDEVRELVKAVRSQASHFESVESAFLELSNPSIPDGLRKAVAEGHQRIIILPYFLSAGRHVTEHIPAEVQKVRDEFPNVEMELITHMGAAGGIIQLLLDQANA